MTRWKARSRWVLKPDFDHSIVNLISALAGVSAPAADRYPPLLSALALEPDSRPLVLLVVDGLGDNWLAKYPDSFLAQHRIDRLSTVFPTTTAAAVSALALGVAPNQHGIPGWFTYLPELGAVTAPLPFIPRGSRECFSKRGVEASAVLGVGPLLPRIHRSTAVVQPSYIADSSYSQALFGLTPRHSHCQLAHCFSQLSQVLKQPGNPWVWGYWTELDAIGHQYGIHSPQAETHFIELDQAVAQFASEVRAMGALLLVTADHGLVDTPSDAVVRLEQHPGLADLIALPLCGEPRAAFCYLRAGCEQAFDDYVEDVLPQMRVMSREQLLDEDWFGRGESMAGFHRRIGDRILLPEGHGVFRDCLLQERFHPMIGNHGGLSADELFVPLVAVE